MMHNRLLLLITDLLIGGTPSVVRELAARLSRQGVSVEVACLSAWGPTADQIREAGVQVTALNARGAYDFRAIGRLRRLVISREFDVVLSFLVHANVAATLALAGRKGVDLYQSIQTTQPQPRWHWLAQAAVSPSAQRIIVPSESVAQVASQRSMIARERLVVIPNAVDAAEIASITRVTAAAGETRVGFLGRLDPVKRIPDLLAAIATLPPSYHLLVFGTGREEDHLRHEIQRLGLQQRVDLRGAVDRPAAALAEIDLLVLPSEAEGFGLVLIEAMAAGIPVVGSNVPGIRDVIQHQHNGLLVPVSSPPELARAIEAVATSSQLRERLIAGGRASVAERFAWEPVLASYRSVVGV